MANPVAKPPTKGAVLIALSPATEADFRWLLGGPTSREGVRLPDGGVDAPETLRVIRAMMRRVRSVHDRGSWLIIADDEIVGLCSYKSPPTASREVEIGFGIAPARRRLGYATQAVAALVTQALDDPQVVELRAETAMQNIGSQRALQRSGFIQVGVSMDAEEGEMVVWSLSLRT